MILAHPFLTPQTRAINYLLAAALTIPPILHLLRTSARDARRPWWLLLGAMCILSIGTAISWTAGTTRLLTEVGRRIRAGLRAGDTLARYGATSSCCSAPDRARPAGAGRTVPPDRPGALRGKGGHGMTDCTGASGAA
jgi:hypothetical protein